MARVKNPFFNKPVSVSLLLLLAFSTASFAGVVSTTVDVKMANGEGREAYVRCHGDDGDRVLVNLNGQKNWCDSKVTDLCSFKKSIAAKLVCSSDYSEQFGSAKTTPVKDKIVSKKLTDTEVLALKQELMSIEAQRIIIGEKLLVLRLKEIELSRSSLSSMRY